MEQRKKHLILVSEEDWKTLQWSLRRQDSLLDSRYTYDDGPNNPPTTFIFGPLYLASKVYQLSPIESFRTQGSLLDK
ncbi:hypothetical protein L1049_014535 [Liquidambar formosana]|uniref:Uncharacterized protein n=1 Tax=Liquidambar formosana TaxID=63359 RepID=A0AAP0RXA3_LIQFO